MLNTIKQCIKSLISKCCCGRASAKKGKQPKTSEDKKPAPKKTNG